MTEPAVAYLPPIDGKSIPIREMGRLIWKSVPFFRPQIWHLAAWVTLSILINLTFLLPGLLAIDLLNNKVLVGEFLEPVQTRLLLLDQSYSAEDSLEDSVSESDADANSDAKLMTDEQRRVVRNRLLILFAFLGVIGFTVVPANAYYRMWILQRVNQSLRTAMIERAEHLSLRYHNVSRSGDAIYRVYQDSAMITRIFELVLMQPITIFFETIIAVATIALFSATLAVLFVVGLIPILWLVLWYTPRIQVRSRRAREASSDLTSRIQEVFGIIRVVKASQAEIQASRRFTDDSAAALDSAFYLRVELALMRLFTMLISGVVILVGELLMAQWTIGAEPTFLAGIIVFLGFKVWNYGAFEAARGANEETLGSTQSIIGIWSILQDNLVGLERAFFLLDLKPEVEDASTTTPYPRSVSSVTFEDVRFRYQPDVPVIEGVSFQSRIGEITAIVGDSGVGKTTLTSLLLRLYDVDSGSISVNGIDIRQLPLSDLRRNVAVALQQNILFSTSVAKNISYSAEDVSQADIERAAELACAHDFIEQLPQGYDSMLGERSSRLSTGQRQRISIARAIVRDAPILVLDEPTASLDAETEHRILENIASWAADRVVLLITHRLSTIQDADQVVYIEDGQSLEVGSHSRLMSIADGRYRQFVQGESVHSATGVKP